MLLAEYIQLLIVSSSVIFVFLSVIFLIILKLTAKPHPTVIRFDKEKRFLNPATGKQESFPTIDDEPTIDLSVIIPAYDEQERLPKMLDECLEYLEAKSNTTYEVIVVSDGSKDKTVEVALTYANKYGSNKIRVLELVQNRGKGGAVRLGMQSSRGKYLLFADADGATKFSDYDKIEANMKKLTDDHRKSALVIGSRAHLEEEATAQRSFFRTILMHGFHFLVWMFAVKKIRDTQCGFKLLTRSAARTCFSIMHVERWAFDVELLFIAQSYAMPIEEVAVTWTEIDGSKVTPVWSWLQMGRDLFLIWARYAIGAWSLKEKSD